MVHLLGRRVYTACPEEHTPRRMPTSPDRPSDNARKAIEDLEPSTWQAAVVKAGFGTTEATGTSEAATELIGVLGERLVALQRPVRLALQQVLDGLEGRSFGTLEANQAITREVQDLLNRLGLRVVCPKDGCGKPASLRCAAAGNSKTGVFQFDHSAGKRATHKGSSTFPQVTLTDAPPDRRRADRAS